MNIECVKDKLEVTVAKAARVTGRNVSLPILQCVLLEAKQNTLTVRATNLDIGVEYTLPVKVSEEGVAAVPGTVLTSLLSQISDKNIHLESDGENILIKTDSTQTKIKSYNSEDFPTIPRVTDATSFQIDGKLLVEGVKSVAYASATSSVKPELSSVYISTTDDKEGLVFAATDSFRLAEKRLKVKNVSQFNSVLIPVKNTAEITRVIEDQGGSVELLIGANQLAFTGEGVYLTSRTIDGVFPDYQQIIPDNFVTEATILKADLLNALKVAHIFTDKFNKITFSLNPAEKQLTLQTRNTEVGENTQSIDGALNGQELTISFNYRYIFDCFQSINSDSISLQLSGEGKPMVIKGVSDNSFLYLVMPMNQ